MKSAEEANIVLSHYDLTNSYRAAGELAGVSHHTVARYVALRDAGRPPGEPERRERLIDPYLEKMEEWVEESKAKIAGDQAHKKLVVLGYEGSARTTRRSLAEVKAAYRAGRRRVHRPWVPEPGMWFQWDYGTGPVIRGVATVLFCAWLAWSRYRVVFLLRDRTLPSVIGAIDRTVRAFGACPTYGLTDNEKTVTVEHIASIAVRHPAIVAASSHYGMTIATCVPYDPAPKGGVEATVRIAQADLVPTDTNLLPAYESFAAAEAACARFCAEVNARPHAVTRRPPIDMLAEERAHLHRLPDEPYTAAFGVTRSVPQNTPMVAHDYCSYSVPHQLMGQVVWVREESDDDIVFVHVGRSGAREVARHRRTTPGNPRVDPDHFPPQPEGPLHRTPKARNAEEAVFLAIGPGASLWLTEAAQAGTRKVKAKMADAVALAKLTGSDAVDWALGHAAVSQRFKEGDLAAIVAHRAQTGPGQTRAASETHSLQPSTKEWEDFGS